MPALGIPVLLVQVGFAVHVVRTGRPYWWIYIIVLVPLVGCLAYFAAELLPELLGGRTARQAAENVRTLVDPERHYRAAADRLADAETVETRRDLAEQCMNLKRYQEAIDLYQGALTGLYAKDPHLMLGLAEAQLMNGAPAKAAAVLEDLRAHNPRFNSTAGHLLYARALDEADRIADALREYEALVRYYPGEEARARFGLLLVRSGDEEGARAVFTELVRKVDRAPKHYAAHQREWYAIAKRHLAA